MPNQSPRLAFVTSLVVSILTVFAAVFAAMVTADSQVLVATEQIKSAAEKAKQDRRQDAYTDLYASLITKREALVAMRCADKAFGNVVDREQQLVLDAAAKDADTSWNRSWSRTDLYASNNLRTTIRDLKSVEQSTHYAKGSGGVLLAPNSGNAQEYAKCEATLKDFDSRVVAIRETIQKDLGMDES